MLVTVLWRFHTFDGSGARGRSGLRSSSTVTKAPRPVRQRVTIRNGVPALSIGGEAQIGKQCWRIVGSRLRVLKSKKMKSRSAAANHWKIVRRESDVRKGMVVSRKHGSKQNTSRCAASTRSGPLLAMIDRETMPELPVLCCVLASILLVHAWFY